ncbi:DUF5050 domain-containing protein [Bacillus massilinigeriensis]|uniref:DUF5050 domain-containing protein n=1 Tax=Bacillus massilionigeriensis TaxID=1805475 RepID=UPI00096AE713|nr:DUF5050 domain-containing protein [Bacillus massilionigeriensis]
MKTCRKLTVLLIIVCFLIPSYQALAATSESETTKQEIKNGNFNNGTLSNSGKNYVEDDKYIYFIDYPNNSYHGIYRMNKDGTHKKLISKGEPYYLTFSIDDNYIYAVRNLPAYTIVRMKKDGTQAKYLNLKIERKGNSTRYYASETIIHMMVHKGWIYYTDKNGDLWRFTTSYKKKKKVKSKVGTFSIINDQIYYENNGYLYKMKTDGSNSKKISNEKVWSFYVNGSWIYYITMINGNYGIKKITVNGTNNKIIFSHESNSVEGFLILDDQIYFTMETDEEAGGLFKLKKDAENIRSMDAIEKLDTGYCFDLQVLNHSLWYTRKSGTFTRLDLNSNRKTSLSLGYKKYIGNDNNNIFYIDSVNKMFNAGGLYKASLNGKDPVLLAEEPVDKAILSSNSIYYTEEYGAFYKIQKDGSGKTLLSGSSVGDFQVYDDQIIYQGSYNISGNYNLNIMNLDGSNSKLIATDSSELLAVKGSWVYYLSDNKLIRIKTNGTSKETLAAYSNKNIYIQGDKLYYVSNDRSIYYKKLGTTSSAKKVKVYDVKTKKETSAYASSILKVDSKSIYYSDLYQNIVKVPIIGGAKQTLVQEALTTFPTQDNNLYYIGNTEKLRVTGTFQKTGRCLSP